MKPKTIRKGSKIYVVKIVSEMKLGFLLVVAFACVRSGRNSECCSEERCPICRDVVCRCESFGCDEDGKMSLKKLILHFLQKVQRKANEEDDPQEEEDEEEEEEANGIAQLVRILRDILNRASRLTVNEEVAIRDMILTRLRTLDGKCPCLEQPHEKMAKSFLRLLLDKCLVCDCGSLPCDYFWSKKSCDPPAGIYWFKTTEENLRRERPKREEGKRRGDPSRRWGEFDNEFKCRRFFGDDEVACDEFSICTDCDSCQVVPRKGKEDVWLFCDGCKVVNPPYVEFTRGGSPIKVTHLGNKRFFKIKTRYLQLNDFRPEQKEEKLDKTNFECPSLSAFERKKNRKRWKSIW